jgi:hypothetical protein
VNAVHCYQAALLAQTKGSRPVAVVNLQISTMEENQEQIMGTGHETAVSDPSGGRTH